MCNSTVVQYDNNGLDKCYRALLSAIALQAYEDLVVALRKRNLALKHSDPERANGYQTEADAIIRWFSEGLDWGTKVQAAAEAEASGQKRGRVYHSKRNI